MKIQEYSPTTLDNIYDVVYSGLTRSWCYALLYENLQEFFKKQLCSISSNSPAFDLFSFQKILNKYNNRN